MKVLITNEFVNAVQILFCKRLVAAFIHSRLARLACVEMILSRSLAEKIPFLCSLNAFCGCFMSFLLWHSYDFESGAIIAVYRPTSRLISCSTTT